MAVSDGEGGVLIAYLDHGLPNGSAVNIPMPCFGASNGTEKGAAPRPAAPYPRPICATLQPESHPKDPKLQGRRLAIASAPSPSGPWSYVYPKVEKPGWAIHTDGDIVSCTSVLHFGCAVQTWWHNHHYNRADRSAASTPACSGSAMGRGCLPRATTTRPQTAPT